LALLKCAEGRSAEERGMEVLRGYESTGIVRIGFDFSQRGDQAKLTESGKKLLGLAG